MNTLLLYYCYTDIPDPLALQLWQKELCTRLSLRGRIIIAKEGINGTVGGTRKAIKEFKFEMRKYPAFRSIDFKHAEGSAENFPRLSVRVRDEIVSLGKNIDEIHYKNAGKHLSPEKFHELIDKDENIVIIDGRNEYESRVGAFKNALTPPTKMFKELPTYLDTHFENLKDKKILMYCTGGVRCERASAYLKSKGIDEVYQLEGGIHRYVEKYPDGHFRGKNYVFDSRISHKTNDDVLAQCDLCEKPCDDYTNCLRAACSKHFIACVSCKRDYKNFCSKVCFDAVIIKKEKSRPEFKEIHTV